MGMGRLRGNTGAGVESKTLLCLPDSPSFSHVNYKGETVR